MDAMETATRKLVEVPPQPRWFFSTHVLSRMGEMSLEREQVLDIIDDPDVSYPSEGRRVAVRDGLAVVYEEGRIVTVLLHEQKRWKR